MTDKRTFADYRQHIAFDAGSPTKGTLFRSPRLMLGLNCLSPGQRQSLHSHADQDKFYLVLEGVGDFEVGERRVQAGPGTVVWAPAGEAHAVANGADTGLVVLVGIAPGG